MNLNIRQKVILSIKIILALVFLSASVLKIFSFNDFLVSLSNLVPSLSSYKIQIGSLVILAEMLAGILILFSKNEKLALLPSLVLTMLFISILSYHQMMGSYVSCNCFGILSSYTSIGTQLIIDVIVLNLLILCYFLISNETLIMSFSNNKYSWLVVGILFFSIDMSLLELALKNTSENNITVNSLISKIDDPIFKAEFNRKSNKLIFLVSLKDFSCPLCYDSFLSVIDSLNKLSFKKSAIFVFEKTEDPKTIFSEKKITEWKKLVGIEWPSYFISKMYFSNFIKKSSLLIFNEQNRIVFNESFPIGLEKLKSLYSNYVN